MIGNIMKKTTVIGILVALLSMQVSAQDLSNPLTVAILPFSERGQDLKGQGQQVADLLYAAIAVNPSIWLVERDNLKQILDELELSASGMVTPEQQNKIGQMTGARLLVTGSVFKVQQKTFIVAKIIGTETSRVLAKSVDGAEPLDILAAKLGSQVAATIVEKGKEVLPVVKTEKDVLAELQKALVDKVKRPVYVNIVEQDLSAASIDPAAETEMQKMLKELGFPVKTGTDMAEIIVSGEAISQFGARYNNMASVVARVEIKVADKEGNVIAIDRQTAVAIGVSEAVVGKQAIQNATVKIAERIIPKMVK
jgi:TolB-like protein